MSDVIEPSSLRSGDMAEFTAIKAGFHDSMRQVAAQPVAVDEDYWTRVRSHFLLDPGLAYLNTGTVGATPEPVYRNLAAYWRMMAANPNENSAILQGRQEAIRQKAAEFLGALPSEVAILRNATEGNALVCHGIDLNAGDEVLIGSLEHDSNRQPWLLKAKRQGITVKEVLINTPPSHPEEIVDAFESAFTPRTKIVSLAHCDTVTGTFTPIREIAGLAHSKGARCFVDGAQTLGMIQCNVHELDVDAYTTTCHKWLCSPAGTGLLYIRRDLQQQIWPNIATENWQTFQDARQYDHLSRRPWPVVASLEDALDFQLAVGRSRIESRMRSLATYLRAQAGAIPGVRLYTSNDPRLSGALTTLSLEGVPSARLREHLRQHYNIYTAARSQGAFYPADPHGVDGIRLSTHYYNTLEQVERVLQGLRELASRRP